MAPGVVSGVMVLLCASVLRLAIPARRRSTTVRRLHPASGPVRRLGAITVPVPVPARVAGAVESCAIDLDPAALWLAWLVGAPLTLVGGLAAGGVGAALVAGVAAVAGPIVAWRLLRHRHAAQLEAALPSVVEAVARGLRSGGSLRQALDEAAAAATGALASDLSAVVGSARRGAPLVEALESWAQRRPLPGVRLAVAALCLGAETGGAQARAVDGVAATLRMRLATQAEAHALATQARASAALITVAPLAFCAVASATDARTATFLFRTPLGLVMLGAGLALDALGALWMARLTRIEP